MADLSTDDRPHQSVLDVRGDRVAEAFSLLGNETRLAILLALWDAHEPHEGGTLSFTELRNRVGIRQGGQFNFHLDKVVGEFVRKTDEGYTLRQPGLMLVQSIIAGTGISDPHLDPTEIDARCVYCGDSVAVTYQAGRVYQVCTSCEGGDFPADEHPDGAILAWTFEPTGVNDRTPEEVFSTATVKTFSRIALRFEGICPDCSGVVEWSVDICEDHAPRDDGRCPVCGRVNEVQARESCTVCKSAGRGSPGIKVLFHPAVIAFLHEHGLEVGFSGNTGFRDVVEILTLVESFEEEVLSTDPPRIRVSIPRDEEELRLTLDGALSVKDVDRLSRATGAT